MAALCLAGNNTGNTADPRLRGFTLVEVVVALAILSLLMIAVLAALRALGSTQVALDQTTRRIDDVRAVSSFLRDGLEAAVAGGAGMGTDGGLGFGGGVEGDVGSAAFFKGDESSFQWKAKMVFGENVGGVFLLRVGRVEDALELSWQRPPMPIAAAVWGNQPSRVLVKQLQELQISYRGALGAPWQSQWQQAHSPALVKLVIKTKDRFWPELVMAVQR